MISEEQQGQVFQQLDQAGARNCGEGATLAASSVVAQTPALLTDDHGGAVGRSFSQDGIELSLRGRPLHLVSVALAGPTRRPSKQIFGSSSRHPSSYFPPHSI